MAEDKGYFDTPLSLEQLVQQIGNIAQILGRITADLENGTGLLWQPLNSRLTSISGLTVASQDLLIGSGANTFAALAKGADNTLLNVSAGNLSYRTLTALIDAIFGSAQGSIIQRGATVWDDFGPGTSGQFLKTQGAAANVVWADALVKVVKQVFTSGGTYTPTTGMVTCIVEAVGGGAGGGGAANAGAGNQGGGGGGGGGSYARLVATAATIGASQTVTIGAAANGGTAGNNNGTAGNDTSLGALCIGKGGSAGGGGASGAQGAGGAGGVAGTGDFSVPGEAGGIHLNGSIVTVNLQSARGGISGLGFGAGGTPSSGAGSAGSNYGGGGGGGHSVTASGAAAGGNGAQGIVVVTEFCKV